MGEAAHGGDDAAAEGFFGTLKRERVHRRLYLALAEVRINVLGYIERLNNQLIRRTLHTKNQVFRLLTQPSVETR